MWRCTRCVAMHPNRRGVMPTVRVRCPSEQAKVRSVCAEMTVLHRERIAVIVACGLVDMMDLAKLQVTLVIVVCGLVDMMDLAKLQVTLVIVVCECVGGEPLALHPLCGATPEQKGCNAYGSGALPLRTSESVGGVCRGDCVAQRGGLSRRRCVWIGGHDGPREVAGDPRYRCVWSGVQGASRWRCTRCVALHPLCGAAPVTLRCTRTEGV